MRPGTKLSPTGSLAGGLINDTPGAALTAAATNAGAVLGLAFQTSSFASVLEFLGTLGTYSLPLASSDINETDAVVRARDGQIIAIGGLMRQASVNSDSGLPGAQGTLFRKLFGGQTNNLTEKRELVILLKPTVIDPTVEDEGTADSLSRLLEWTEAQARPRR